MTVNILEEIQSLQFTDKPAAEMLLLNFVRETFALAAQSVEIRPLAVSLNSFNGFLTLQDESRLFFKTHTEPGGVIGEYYNAMELAEAGYPVLQPLYSSTEAGKQFLIYEVITDPSVFEVAWSIENGDESRLKVLTDAQNKSDDDLLGIYKQSLALQNADDAANSPVHQLFYHRLTGGRLGQFYGDENQDVTLKLPHSDVSMRDIRQLKWIINDQLYDETLNDIIQRAINLLNPAQSGASVIGHGDAHNGNVFLRSNAVPEGELLYFDPAFAGRHHPILDITKPLFHNVFAMWMYYPHEKRQSLKIEYTIDGDTLNVSHNYSLLAVREMFLQSKVGRVLIPVLQLLKLHGMLSDNWKETLKSALFCCPFLTMNLTNSAKFPPEISLLGLSMAVEMGAESRGKRSKIDQVLDEVAAAL